MVFFTVSEKIQCTNKANNIIEKSYYLKPDVGVYILQIFAWEVGLLNSVNISVTSEIIAHLYPQ